MVGTKISGLTGGPSYCQPGGAGHASLSSTPLVPRGASASRGKIRLSQPIIRRGGPDSFAATGARAFSKKEKAAGMTAQSIDLRQASDPRIERVGDRLGRSALIDQRQRDARVSGSLYAPMCGSTR